MKILHVAAFNRWTGAAAPAFEEVEALRSAGVEAHYAYVGGDNLQERVGHLEYTHPALKKRQDPSGFLQSVSELRSLLKKEQFDFLHAHLTYDHSLIAAAALGTRARIVRTFHSRRTLRKDPFTKALIRRTAALGYVNADFAGVIPKSIPSAWTPPPVDRRTYNSQTDHLRERYQLAPNTPVVGIIGKVSRGRGFEAAIQTLPLVTQTFADARLLVIGHGPHEKKLRELARNLGVADRLIWAGYQEAELPQHYRTADVMVFTARGSDEGHRAIIEELACGSLVACYPLPGVKGVLGELSKDLLASATSPDALAETVKRLLHVQTASIRIAAEQRSEFFGYAPTAERLLKLYDRALSR